MPHKSLNMLLQTILVGESQGTKVEREGETKLGRGTKYKQNATRNPHLAGKFHNSRENLKIEALAFQHNTIQPVESALSGSSFRGLHHLFHHRLTFKKRLLRNSDLLGRKVEGPGGQQPPCVDLLAVQSAKYKLAQKTLAGT